MKIQMKPTKTNLTRTKKRPETPGFFLAPSELKDCLFALEEGGIKSLSPSLGGRAVRFCVSLLEEKCPGESLEVRVVPFAACKVLQGSKPDPHNLMPPDFFEVDPEIFLEIEKLKTEFSEKKLAVAFVGAGDFYFPTKNFMKEYE